MFVPARFRHLHFCEIGRVVKTLAFTFRTAITIPHFMYLLPLDLLNLLKENNPHLYKGAPGRPKDIIAADGIP